MTRATVPSLVNVAYGRDVSWEDVMRMGAVSVVGAWGANKVCGWYLGNQNSYWAHKAIHYGLGFGMGAALDPRNWVKAGIAGGTAAMVSEMLGEGLIGSPEELQRNPIDPESVKGQLFFAKVVGAIAGSLICEGADPMAAMLIARNAVENNFVCNMWQAFEDQTASEETWEDRVEQERLVQEAYTGFRSSLVGKVEDVAGTPGKVAVDFLMPSHHNLIVPELMMNVSGLGAMAKFAVKAPKYAPNLLRMAPKAFDVTKGFWKSLINPWQVVKTTPAKGTVVQSTKNITRQQRWKDLASGGNKSRLPKEVRAHIERHGGKGVSDKFGLELAHKPKMAKAQGHDYSNAVPKTIADHRGIQHRFLQESAEGTKIIKGGHKPNKLTLPKPGKLPR